MLTRICADFGRHVQNVMQLLPLRHLQSLDWAGVKKKKGYCNPLKNGMKWRTKNVPTWKKKEKHGDLAAKTIHYFMMNWISVMAVMWDWSSCMISLLAPSAWPPCTWVMPPRILASTARSQQQRTTAGQEISLWSCSTGTPHCLKKQSLYSAYNNSLTTSSPQNKKRKRPGKQGYSKIPLTVGCHIAIRHSVNLF